jgi:hypothetical protein
MMRPDLLGRGGALSRDAQVAAMAELADIMTGLEACLMRLDARGLPQIAVHVSHAVELARNELQKRLLEIKRGAARTFEVRRTGKPDLIPPLVRDHSHNDEPSSKAGFTFFTDVHLRD